MEEKPWERYRTLGELIDSLRGKGVSNAEAGSISMQYLMRKQFGDKPPNPCPCY
ncbi:MAG TPA: hypothetical protein VNU25_03555 [Candidatus Paceibacterota bacterium]|nr:hypothetical protein [Candidatus Paceibacterota bacterium]